MAKDLPYFKFFVSEWNDGDITLEDYQVQGLFINICSYYWSNECNLSFKKTLKKFKDADYDLFKALIDSDIIKVEGDELIISFLDEQQGERRKTSKKNSEAGKISALKRWGSNEKVTPVTKACNESVTIKRREEERREENTTIENIYNKFLEEIKVGGFATRIESLYMRLKIREGSLTPLLKDFKSNVIEQNTKHKDTNDFFINFVNWLNVQDRINKLDKYR